MNQKYLKNKRESKTNGFTIIEVMISVALFIIVVMAGMGALLNANAVHQKSQNMRSIMDNLSFITEEMSRNIRTGYDYHCIDNSYTLDLDNIPTDPLSCAVSAGTYGWALSFKSPDTSGNVNQWLYYFDNDTGNLYKIVNNGPKIQLNPDEVKFNLGYASRFSVNGAEPGDDKQPFVIIKLSGLITSTKDGVTSPFSLQTAVSQRLVDM